LKKKYGLGIVGAGGFGLFALQHFTQVEGIELKAISGTHRPAAFAAAERFDVPVLESPEELFVMDDVDIVYISTPPFLHYDQSMSALQAGKNVICEKPLAINPAHAKELVNFAKEKDLMMVTNLMQRYNPMYDDVKTLIDSGILGKPLHGFFENYATDEGLLEDHWFWDKEKSGGIFIEHGVHFFDMFKGWLGDGKLISSQKSLRNGDGVEDQVQCTVKYGEEIFVNFYHGFTQAGRMDRQEFRILFEKGDITLYEWVPTNLKIRALGSERDTRLLLDVFPDSRLKIESYYFGKDRSARGRFKDIDAYQKFEIFSGESNKKMHIYGDLIYELMKDQLQWLNDRSHKRKITEDNGRDSLLIAAEADRTAFSK
jgi:predicted dehydrogenase